MAPKNKNALGTGLGVLFGDDDDVFENVGTVETISVSKIEPRKEQPRNYFDEEALNTLSESIKKYGLIQPIAVRKIRDDHYQIIAGERRWRASRLAGLQEVPVRIIDADDKTTAELALIENLQRENLSPVEEAKGYQALLDDFDMTHEEVAESVGKSRPAITNSLRLLALSPKVLELVEEGTLSSGHARALLAVQDAGKQLELANEVISKNLSVRKIESIVSDLQKPHEEESHKKKLVDYCKEESENLSKILGRKVKLTDGPKTGKIEIEFYGPEDRENLINKIKNIK